MGRALDLREVAGAHPFEHGVDLARGVVEEHPDQVDQELGVAVVAERDELIDHRHVQDVRHAGHIGGRRETP